MSITRQRLLVFLIPLFLSMPFLNRAYFVDDSYFVEIASWLKDHPTQPYHFRADDAGPQNRGWEEDGFVRMVNPLFHHYYLALLLKAEGDEAGSAGHEWFLRLGCVLLSCFAALFIFGLARRFTAYPLWATLLVLVTPAFWLTSHSLLIDSTAGFLFVGALYFYIRSTETDSAGLSLASGVFMGAAFLTKYPTLLLIPLTLVWALFRWKKLSRRWIFFLPMLIGLMMLGAYQMWTAELYGRPHILAASARMVSVFGWPKLLVFLVFYSGTLILPLIAWGAVGIKRAALYLGLVAGLTYFFASAVGGFELSQAVLMGFWTVSTVLFLMAFVLERGAWVYPRDYFVFAWIVGFFLMMFVVMGWVAARYYTIVVPATAFLAVRLIEIKWPHRAVAVFKALFVFVFLCGAALAYADYRQANTMRRVAVELKENGFSGGERHFFLGDSFISSYLKHDGWVPCFPQTELKAGDWVLAREITMPLIWFYRKPLELKEIAHFEYPTVFPVKVMHFRGSAGFYASIWGALPFTFYQGPWERFKLYEVVKA
jgi:hypothetical protein